MRYHDALSEACRQQVSNHDDVPGVGVSPMGFEAPAPDALFAELERRLAGADELRILDSGWLGRGAFAREIGARVEAFRARGGVVATLGQRGSCEP